MSPRRDQPRRGRVGLVDVDRRVAFGLYFAGQPRVVGMMVRKNDVVDVRELVSAFGSSSRSCTRQSGVATPVSTSAMPSSSSASTYALFRPRTLRFPARSDPYLYQSRRSLIIRRVTEPFSPTTTRRPDARVRVSYGLLSVISGATTTRPAVAPVHRYSKPYQSSSSARNSWFTSLGSALPPVFCMT